MSSTSPIARRDQVSSLGVGRQEAALVGDAELHAVAFAGHQHLGRAVQVDGHRLFAQDGPRLARRGGDRPRRVSRVPGGNRDDVEARLVEHLAAVGVVLRVVVVVVAEDFVVLVHRRLAQVGYGNDLVAAGPQIAVDVVLPYSAAAYDPRSKFRAHCALLSQCVRPVKRRNLRCRKLSAGNVSGGPQQRLLHQQLVVERPVGLLLAPDVLHERLQRGDVPGRASRSTIDTPAG